MPLCIVLLLVVWFEFKFVEFKFKSNLFEYFCKKENRKYPFRPKSVVRPVSLFFYFLFFATRSTPAQFGLFPWRASQELSIAYISTAPVVFFRAASQAAAGPRPLPFFPLCAQAAGRWPPCSCPVLPPGRLFPAVCCWLPSSLPAALHACTCRHRTVRPCAPCQATATPLRRSFLLLRSRCCSFGFDSGRLESSLT